MTGSIAFPLCKQDEIADMSIPNLISAFPGGRGEFSSAPFHASCRPCGRKYGCHPPWWTQARYRVFGGWNPHDKNEDPEVIYMCFQYAHVAFGNRE